MINNHAKISKFTANSEMHKHYVKGEKPKPLANMAYGLVETLSIDTPDELSNLIASLDGNQVLSTFVNKTNISAIKTARNADGVSAIARTLKYFGTNLGPQIVMLDYDFKAVMPENMKLSPVDLQQTVNELLGNSYRMLGCNGGSSLVAEIGTAPSSSRPQSQHIYLWLANGTRVKDFCSWLNYQCIKRGFAWAKIHKNGNIKIEFLFDNAPLINFCTLCFEALPTVGEGLYLLDKSYLKQDGEPFDTDFSLSEDEQKEFEKLKRDLELSVRDEAEKIRIDWVKQKGNELKAKGLHKSHTEAVISGRITAHGDKQNLYFLSPYDVIKTTEGTFRVSEIVADNHFHFIECVDPDDIDDPKDCDRFRAIIRFRNEGVSIYSQASGGKMYILKKEKVEPPADILPTEPAVKIPGFIDFAPDIKTSKHGVSLKPTVSNFKAMLACYGVVLVQDVIKRENRVIYPNQNAERGNLSNDADVRKLIDLCSLNELPEKVVDLRPILFNQNRVNPVTDMFNSVIWDGRDRFIDLANSVKLKNTDDTEYFHHALKMWLLQCVAAADFAKSTPLAKTGEALKKFEQILTFVSPQGDSKTEWFGSLLPDDLKDYYRKGQILKIDDKDSVFQTTSFWITELGEIESTFKKSDIDQLKAFMSNSYDEMRRPYGIETCKFERRTSFCASVNSAQFLQDTTGNRRFLPIEILECNRLHGVDMRQLWAQLWEEYLEGAKWWYVKGDAFYNLVLKHQRGAMAYDMIVEEFIKHYGGDDSPSEFGSVYRITAKELAQLLKTVSVHGLDAFKFGVKPGGVPNLWMAYLNISKFTSIDK